MTTFNINQDHNSDYRPKYQLGISKPPTKIPEYSSLDILRPENYDKYYTTVPTEIDLSTSIYKGLEFCFVLSKGSGYDFNSTLILDTPDDPAGTQAQGELCFGLTEQSINIESPGSGYQVNDVISISNSDPSSLAILFVDEIDNNGGIVSFFIIDPGCFKNSHPSIVQDSNGTALLSFNTDQYNISSVDITEPGDGYLLMDPSGYFADHEPIVSGIGSGFMGYITTYQNIYSYADYNTENSIINTRTSNIIHTKYGTEILSINFS